MCLPAHLPPPPGGRIVVVGAGKAAAAMASVVDRYYQSQYLTGVVVTAPGYGLAADEEPCRIEVLEAGHPVPDARSQIAAHRILDAVAGLAPKDLVLCLISGGGSALLALPAPGIALEDKIEITRALLKSGAAISDINCVRKHLSAIKGGRLAIACRPARLVTLIISDVPGDDPADVASGPTVGDRSTVGDARAVLRRYRIRGSGNLAQLLEQAVSETPKPGGDSLARAENKVIMAARDALAAVAHKARQAGYDPIILGDGIEGEAAEVGRDHGELALGYVGQAGKTALISGGELTVTLGDARRRGGPNMEYILSLMLGLGGARGIWAIAGDSDGSDGSQDSAGALIGPDSLERARALGLNPGRALEDHDSYDFFARLGGLHKTGPTRTNVNDLRIILID